MATVYLSPTGNDANTYAQAQNIATPWATPGKVQSSAVTGDTVSMAAGTYVWVTVSFTKSFTWIGASLSNGFPTTILDGAAAAITWTTAQDIAQTFTNIMFQNALCNATNNVIFYMTAGGASLSGYTLTNCVIRTVVISNPSGARGVGLFGDSDYGTLPVTLTNCLLYGITSTSFTTVIFLSSGGNWTIANCAFSFASGHGFTKFFDFAAGGGAGFSPVVKNCIGYNAGASISFMGSATPTPVTTYSDFFGFTNYGSGAGVITSDPLFVDVVNANFKLRPTSPCIGTGTLA